MENAAKPWPAEVVTKAKTAELIPYARNARTHSEEQIKQIAAAILEWGWTQPILIDEKRMVLAGHGRLMAAERLGLEEIPVIVADGWSEAQKRAYVIVDNKLTEKGGWDANLLQLELADLESLGFEFELLDELTGAFGQGEQGAGAETASLADKFGVPPFSVLNAREGWWQARKAAWIALGIQSELGRGGPPGGSRRPSTQINPETGHFMRADSYGRPIAGT